ncbi:MAG: hypothetical protein IIY92_02110 [Lachnospiraceae bacterium]|nr:hypothetical protein [Lachnospiraceae bacterium]
MLQETITRLILGHCEANAEDILPETAFKSLGMDSLDITEMMLDLEDELGIRIDYSVDAKVKTVGELMEFVEQLL